MSRKKLAGIIVACAAVTVVAIVLFIFKPWQGPASAETYALTTVVNPIGAGSVSPSGGEYESGAQVTLTADPADGYTFDYWAGGASGNTASVAISMDSDKTITANFKAATKVAWDKTFGGSVDDQGYSVRQTSDGGYIIAGSTGSYATDIYDVLLIKTDSSGNLAWNKTFGGSDGDYGESVKQTSDGGYVIAGYTGSYKADIYAEVYDVLLIKTDSSGNVAWNKTFGGSGDNRGFSVQQTPDGGYIIAGRRDGDFWLIKTYSSGNMEWDQTFGRPVDHEQAHSVQQTLDGGYIVAGWKQNLSGGYAYADVWLIKADSSGKVEWDQTFGGSGCDEAYSVQQTSDGGYIIAGWTQPFESSNTNVLLIKMDSSGNVTWNKIFGGLYPDRGYSVQQTSDGGYIIAGSRGSPATSHDVWLLKTDSSGNEEWNKTFGGSDYDHGYSVQQTSDGGYIIVGDTTSYGDDGYADYDVWLIKVTV